MKKKFLLFWLFLVQLGCYDPLPIPPPLDPPITKTQLEVVWYKYLSFYKDTASRESLKPFLFKDKVITTTWALFTIENEQIHCLDKKTGDRKWMWDDYFDHGFGGQSYFANYSHKPTNSGEFLWFEGRSFYSIDLNSGNTIKKLDLDLIRSEIGEGYSGAEFSENCCLSSYGLPTMPFPDSITLFQFNIDMSFYPVFSLKARKNLAPHINNTFLRIDFKGDSLMIGSVTWADRNDASNLEADLFCYNKSKKMMEWHVKNLSFYINPSLNILNDKIYLTAYNEFYCIDVNTGSTIWKGGPPYSADSWFHDPITIGEGKIFAKASSGHVYCIDQNTGNILWSNTLYAETGASGFGEGAKIEYHKGRIYFSDNNLFILDANTGKYLYKLKVPKTVPQYAENYIEGICIDPETDLMYFTDGYHLVCTKLPK